LRAGIARGRLCASILVIAQRKTALIRALHGRQPWPDLSSMGGGHGSSPERKGGSGGEGQGARLLGHRGGVRLQHGDRPGLLSGSVLLFREEEEDCCVR
jgi:hypothetical protein